MEEKKGGRKRKGREEEEEEGREREEKTPWLEKIGRSKRRVKWNVRIWLKETKYSTLKKVFQKFILSCGDKNDNFGQRCPTFSNLWEAKVFNDCNLALEFVVLRTEQKLPFCIMDLKSLANITSTSPLSIRVQDTRHRIVFLNFCSALRTNKVPQRLLQFTVAGIAWILEAHFAVWCGRSEGGKRKLHFPFPFFGNAASEIPARHARFRRTIIRGMGARAKKKENKRNGGGSRSDIAFCDELFKLGQECQNSDPEIYLSSTFFSANPSFLYINHTQNLKAFPSFSSFSAHFLSPIRGERVEGIFFPAHTQGIIN